MKRNAISIILVALLCGCALLSSCKKDANGTTTNTSKKNLTTGIWTLQKIQYQQPDGSWANDTDPQDLDKVTVVFNGNNTTSENENGYTNVGTWETSSDFAQLTLGDTGEMTGTFSVHVLTASSMQLDEAAVKQRFFFVH